MTGKRAEEVVMVRLPSGSPLSPQRTWKSELSCETRDDRRLALANVWEKCTQTGRGRPVFPPSGQVTWHSKGGEGSDPTCSTVFRRPGVHQTCQILSNHANFFELFTVQSEGRKLWHHRGERWAFLGCQQLCGCLATVKRRFTSATPSHNVFIDNLVTLFQINKILKQAFFKQNNRFCGRGLKTTPQHRALVPLPNVRSDFQRIRCHRGLWKQDYKATALLIGLVTHGNRSAPSLGLQG